MPIVDLSTEGIKRLMDEVKVKEEAREVNGKIVHFWTCKRCQRVAWSYSRTFEVCIPCQKKEREETRTKYYKMLKEKYGQREKR